MRFVLMGRGSGTLADRLSTRTGVSATDLLPARELSRHLQACDLLLQPYGDGVSGRRTTTISALEHGVPVVTTFGRLSEPFWRETSAVETIAAEAPGLLAGAVERLLEPRRHGEARSVRRQPGMARLTHTRSQAPGATAVRRNAPEIILRDEDDGVFMNRWKAKIAEIARAHAMVHPLG